MAQYKVLQDIEADDKLLGPLSLRQFIYAVVVVVMGFVAFRLVTVAWFLAIPFLPPMIFFGLLAAPFGRDQPSEVWLLAKIRFVIKTRRRIWDQAGVKELVTITVPKQIERVVTKGFSQQEVKSRLNALAATLDTRGWAVKNIDVSAFQQPLLATSSASDRLVDISSIPQDTAGVAVDPASDILDEENNPIAQHVDQTLQQSTQVHREELLQKVRTLAETEKIVAATATPGAVPQPTISPAMQALVNDINQKEEQAKMAQNNMRRLEPLPSSPTSKPQTTAPQSTPATATNPDPQQISIQHTAPAPQPAPQPQAQTPMTPPSDPGILKLVKNNDLNVATIGRVAGRKNDNEPPQDEVVIPLR